MTSRRVELRSDTFTRPTEAMRRAMYEAEVGDDVWGEDPTVQRLERQAAALMGKEAGLFVASGTQGNLVGLLSHTAPGDEVILGDQSHIFWYEVAGASVVGGLQLRTLPNGETGRLAPAEVRAAIRGEDIHFPRTGCVALENTHNRCGGAVLTAAETQAVADVAHEAGIPVHLDGARIFNAAVALGVPAAALAAPVDSVTFCLSKALGAPVGSVLCGSRDYIARARHWRKLLGGGMRQVGVLAAAGLVALKDNVERLSEDQANACALAEGLAQISGIGIDPARVQSNIVVFDVAGLRMSPQAFAAGLADRGVLVAPFGGTRVRA
ncbi:MAG: low-specificity L-threonine aldolase, partial [Chloroflexi bacterium]|nr:low-specificity L-threonine aldolase [Chloroflexota bacterium]